MKRALAVILPLLILSAAAFAQDSSADSESETSDFLKELSKAAEPEASSASETAEADSGEDADEEDNVAVKPPVPGRADSPEDRQARNKKIFRGMAVGFDVLGAGLFAYGIYENSNVTKTVQKNGNKYLKDENAATKRNVAYIVGTVFLASGITIHILF